MRRLWPPARTKPLSLGVNVMLSPHLFHEMNSVNNEASRNRFAHIIDGQSRNAHAGKSLHFNPRKSAGFHLATDADALIIESNIKLDV